VITRGWGVSPVGASVQAREGRKGIKSLIGVGFLGAGEGRYQQGCEAWARGVLA